MFHLKKYESFQDNNSKIIIILGMPGSGKTTLAKELRDDNSGDNFQILDDGEYIRIADRGFFERLRGENFIISDGYLTSEFMKVAFYQLVEKLHEIGIKPDVYIFDYGEKSIENCRKNIRSRGDRPGIPMSAILSELPQTASVLRNHQNYINQNREKFGLVERREVFRSDRS